MKLSHDLKRLVHTSVGLLGGAIAKEFGSATFKNVESMRQRMKSIRRDSTGRSQTLLKRELRALEKLDSNELLKLARSYAVMLELMNVCESAYRSFRLKKTLKEPSQTRMRRLTFVLTAHPTESRRPEVLRLFADIQRVLETHLDQPWRDLESQLGWRLRLLLRRSMARHKKPKVGDEADLIYATALRTELLDQLIHMNQMGLKVRLRTWVGGDKDGHPGVDEKAFLKSLQQSRRCLYDYLEAQLLEAATHFRRFDDVQTQRVLVFVHETLSTLKPLKTLQVGDGRLVARCRKAFQALVQQLKPMFESDQHPLTSAFQLWEIFPALVVPLELRESSDIIQVSRRERTKLAIYRMLKTLKDVAKGVPPFWYARGLIVSQTEKPEDLWNALELLRQVRLADGLPVVPLLESESALRKGPRLIEAALRRPAFLKSSRHIQSDYFEVMLGYSDSSKEAGALTSKLLIAESMEAIDRSLKRLKLKPIFFHGFGGSIERGGGSILEQTAAWPKSALDIVKQTVQGEMVQRMFASPEIFLRSALLFSEVANHRNISQGRAEARHRKGLKTLASRSTTAYHDFFFSSEGLKLLHAATPYAFLKDLKMGSRPAKRKKAASLANLRAIPWVMCWTQNRLLLPAWWGLGSAWASQSLSQRKEIKRLYQQSPFFRSFVRNLGFSLAKVELPVFELYLRSLQHDAHYADGWMQRVLLELSQAQQLFRFVTGHENFLHFRPWLEESIHLRSKMIHPLNLIQIIGMKRKDLRLLRESSAGIACGMMTTG